MALERRAHRPVGLGGDRVVEVGDEDRHRLPRRVALELGEHLASLGTSAEEAYAGCDGACLQSLCEEASAALWERMRGVTTPTPATLAITASGAAKVGDTAEAVQLDGSWVGQLQSAGGVAMAGGKLRGEAAKPQ